MRARRLTFKHSRRSSATTSSFECPRSRRSSLVGTPCSSSGLTKALGLSVRSPSLRPHACQFAAGGGQLRAASRRGRVASAGSRCAADRGRHHHGDRDVRRLCLSTVRAPPDDRRTGGRRTMNPPASITITPVRVADLRSSTPSSDPSIVLWWSHASAGPRGARPRTRPSAPPVSCHYACSSQSLGAARCPCDR